MSVPSTQRSRQFWDPGRKAFGSGQGGSDEENAIGADTGVTSLSEDYLHRAYSLAHGYLLHNSLVSLSHDALGHPEPALSIFLHNRLRQRHILAILSSDAHARTCCKSASTHFQNIASASNSSTASVHTFSRHEAPPLPCAHVLYISHDALLSVLRTDALLAAFDTALLHVDPSVSCTLLLALLPLVSRARKGAFKVLFVAGFVYSHLLPQESGRANSNKLPVVQARCARSDVRIGTVNTEFEDEEELEYVMLRRVTIALDRGIPLILAILPSASHADNLCAALSAERPGVDALSIHSRSNTDSFDAAVSKSLRVIAVAFGHVGHVLQHLQSITSSLSKEEISLVIDCCFAQCRIYEPVVSGYVSLLRRSSRNEREWHVALAANNSAGNGLRQVRVERLVQFDEVISELAPPDVLLEDVTDGLLKLLCTGVQDIYNFNWNVHPGRDRISRSLEKLHLLDALDGIGKVTKVGYAMCALPCNNVLLAKAVIAGIKLRVKKEMLLIMGMIDMGLNLSLKIMKNLVMKYGVEEGDVLFKLNLIHAYRQCASTKKKRLSWAMENGLGESGMLLERCLGIANVYGKVSFATEDDEGLKEDEENVRRLLGMDVAERICRSICSGFFFNAARRTSGLGECGGKVRYRLLRSGVEMRLHKDCILQDAPPEYVVAGEILRTHKNAQWCLKDVTAVQAEWLAEYVPSLFEYTADKDGTQ